MLPRTGKAALTRSTDAFVYKDDFLERGLTSQDLRCLIRKMSVIGVFPHSVVCHEDPVKSRLYATHLTACDAANTYKCSHCNYYSERRRVLTISPRQ